MEDKQTLILVAGGALIGANLLLNGQGASVWQVIWNGTATSNPTEMRTFLEEALFLGILIFAAGLSDGVANIILVILAGLWALWLIRKFGATAATPSTPSKG